MPGGDGTGPRGMGPMTGRGAGYCNGYNVPGYSNAMPSRVLFGRGRGFGMNRGFGRGFYANDAPLVEEQYQQPLSKDQQIQLLEQQREAIEASLKELSKQIESLKK